MTVPTGNVTFALTDGSPSIVRGPSIRSSSSGWPGRCPGSGPTRGGRSTGSGRDRPDGGLGFDTSGVAWWSRPKERTLGVAREALDEPVATALEAEGRAIGWEAARAEALAAAGR